MCLPAREPSAISGRPRGVHRRPHRLLATGQETLNSSAPNPEPATTTEHSIVLSNGGEGRQVQLLQQALGNVKVDGVFGSETEEAVRSFQAAKGLSVDGVVGPQTSAALRGGSGKSFAANFKDAVLESSTSATTKPAATQAATQSGESGEQQAEAPRGGNLMKRADRMRCSACRRLSS